MSHLRIPLAALVAFGAVAGTAGPTLAATHQKAVLRTTTVKVVMTDFAFALSKQTVRQGTVIFKVVNKGATPHDFFLYKVNKKTPLIPIGQSATLKVTLKPGVYHYICTVGEHAFHGMQGDLRVVK